MGMRTIVLIFIYLWALKVSGQELVFSEPVKLGTQINSDDEELAPLLSSDGKTLYFSRAFHANNTGGKYAGTDIWVSKKDDQGNWMPASNMTAHWNNKRSNAVIGVNHDHTVVYLLNAYSNKSGISFSKLNSGIWGEPEFIPIPGINRDDFVGIYVHPDFDVIMISMKGADSFGEEDLYVSLKDSFGNWSMPKNLGPTINTKGFEISPFLSLDKKRLFFSSNGHQGFGDADIFYCDRLFDSWETWGVPKNLGKRINSSSFDGYFSVWTDSLSYFASSLPNGLSNIFTSKYQQVKSTLKDGKQVLSDEDIVLIFGSKISTDFKFEQASGTLTAAQNELLYFIANKILFRPEINMQLQISSFSDGLAEERIKLVSERLKAIGIAAGRIDIALTDSSGKRVDDELLRIVFFR